MSKLGSRTEAYLSHFVAWELVPAKTLKSETPTCGGHEKENHICTKYPLTSLVVTCKSAVDTTGIWMRTESTVLYIELMTL